MTNNMQFAVLAVLAIAILQTIKGQYANSCPRTTDYEYCPLFNYEDETEGTCPSGWTCSGSPTLGSGYSADGVTFVGMYFQIGTDGKVGNATSDYFNVPAEAVELVWERSGGKDAGGVQIEDSDGNVLCTVMGTSNTYTFYEQSCDVTAYVGECIRIFAWDYKSTTWSMVYLNNFQLRDDSGNVVEPCSNSLAPSMSPTAGPTFSPTWNCDLFPIDNFLGKCSSSFEANEKRLSMVEEWIQKFNSTLDDRFYAIEEWKEGIQKFGTNATAAEIPSVTWFSTETKDVLLIALLGMNLLIMVAGMTMMCKSKHQKYRVVSVGADSEMEEFQK